MNEDKKLCRFIHSEVVDARERKDDQSIFLDHPFLEKYTGCQISEHVIKTNREKLFQYRLENGLNAFRQMFDNLDNFLLKKEEHDREKYEKEIYEIEKINSGLITENERKIIEFLLKNDNFTSKEIMNEIQISKSIFWSTMHILERRGIVTRSKVKKGYFSLFQLADFIKNNSHIICYNKDES